MVEAPQFLLVNDHENGLFLLERAVMREFPAAVVVKSRSAEEALGIWQNRKFDALITDNRMPHMEGLDMVRAIRAVDMDTPILMLTGSPQAEAEARAAGVNDFISSGSWDDIRARIRRLLRDASATGEI